MRLETEVLRRLCRERGTTLTALLREAGISRTAYYALARRDSVLPGTVLRLAEALSVPPSDILDESGVEERRAHRRLRRARGIVARNPELSFEDVWHALVLLEEPPIERLRRALRRGRARPVRS